MATTDLQHTAVVILNYNGRKFLEKFLPSVTQHSGNAQIVVADNCSTDDSVAFMQTRYPQVKLIKLNENSGYCGGYNRALAQLNARYFVLLNSDIEVTPNWLTPLVTLLENNTQVAACQPKIRSYAEPHKFEYAGAGGGLIDFLGYPFSRGRLFDTLEDDQGQYDDNMSVFWATGACMLIRSHLFFEMGGLDERFFAHMEEIDLCWRLKNKGHTIWYCGSSVVYHVGGGTLHKSSPRKTFFNFRNGLMLLFKNLPAWQLFPIIFIRLCLDGVAGLRFLLLGEGRNFWAVINAHFSFYRHLPYLIQQRNNWQKIGGKFGCKHKEIYKKSLVYQHFVSGIKTYSTLPDKP